VIAFSWSFIRAVKGYKFIGNGFEKRYFNIGGLGCSVQRELSHCCSDTSRSISEFQSKGNIASTILIEMEGGDECTMVNDDGKLS